VVLVGPIAEFHALQQLIRDVGAPRGVGQRRQPIEPGNQAILDGASLDLARPADDRRDPEAAFEDGTLGRAERRHAAVRPGEDFRTVVGGEDDNGVVGLADIPQVLQ